MNICVLIGNLTCDPSIKKSANGKSIASYRLAVSRPMSKEETDFFQIVSFGGNADFAERFLHKGMKIAINGRIQTRSYDDKDGKKVNVVEIVADRQEFVERKQNNGGYNAPAPVKKNEQPFPPEADFTVLDDEAELPF